MALNDILEAAFRGEQGANRRMSQMPMIQQADTSSIPGPIMPFAQDSDTSGQSRTLATLLPALLGGGNRGGGGGGGDGLGGGGITPSGRGIFFNDDVNVLQPGDPRLVNIGGTQLARPAARSMREILQDLGLQGSSIGGGYRSPEGQRDIYADKPGLAAPPGSSYHQEGLAIDLAAALQNARVERALAEAGWNRFSPSGEPWHWSFGVTG